jgi:hypothetical protein
LPRLHPKFFIAKVLTTCSGRIFVTTDISVKLSVQIPSGPMIQTARTIAVDAYEKIELPLPPDSGKEVIVTLPSGLTGKVKLLLIQSSLYNGKAPTEKITYSIGDKIKERPLDEPQIFLGIGAINDLGPPATITFKNTYPKTDDTKKPPVDLTQANTALLSILIGRVM